jgi:phosphate transport system permease protein
MSTVLADDEGVELSARPVADSEARSTVLHTRPSSSAPQVRRAVGRVSRRDLTTLFGAFGSAVCTTALLFGRLTPLSGRLGFAVVGFLVFVATYALLVSLSDDGPAVVDKVMSVVLTSAAVVAGLALLSVVAFTLWRGRRALTKLNFYIDDMSHAGPLDPLDVGGAAHAIVGTFIIMALALLLTVPLGVTCAVYLNETRGRATGLVRSVVTAMTALPSVLAGLFIFATWILILGMQRSGLAAALAVSIMMMPIIVRSADVVLRLVPGNLREASAALGAPHWRTVWHVVLPTARSGLTTSVILGVSRGIGETAPVLLTAGVASSMNLDPTSNPMMSLPLATYQFARSSQREMIQRGFATAAALMVLVLLVFTIARIVSGRPAGHLSTRQARRAATRSASDVSRFDARAARPGGGVT